MNRLSILLIILALVLGFYVGVEVGQGQGYDAALRDFEREVLKYKAQPASEPEISEDAKWNAFGFRKAWSWLT